MGFTMIELMIAIAVLGILTALLFPSFNSLLASARDNERKSEITKLKVALQVYNTYNDKYPTTTGWISIGEDSSFSMVLDKKYIDILPVDPLYPRTDAAGEKYSYYYNATTSNAYMICAKNESKGGYFCVDKGTNSGVVQTAAMAGLGGFVCGTDTLTFGGLSYGTVVGPDGKCWMDRNLGATQVAVSAADANAYGYYYQWGRPADGHQIETSATTSTTRDSDIPGHANFIMTNTFPYDWRIPQSPNQATLWAGANGGSNNVCPAGWHVPTQPEWATAAGYFSPQTRVGALNSTLKLPLAGYRYRVDASLGARGSFGYYRSSSPSGADASYLYFDSGGVYPAYTASRAYGFSVRCVKD